jgi:RNA-directed DNA polymerase
VGTTETRETTTTKLARIAKLSASDPLKRFDSLMHLFNEESLAACFHGLNGRRAVGVDDVSKAEYGEQLESNLNELIARMRRMGYRPGPVRQVLIPKGDKTRATRPLGISNFED